MSNLPYAVATRRVPPGTKRFVRFGGYGFDVELKFCETRLYQVAPISTNLIITYIAEHILGLPRSF